MMKENGSCFELQNRCDVCCLCTDKKIMTKQKIETLEGQDISEMRRKDLHLMLLLFV